ncbi:hemerythrin domain-containing protein [Uliginosibacterium sp. 31-16]|uniref:hemerythrin domain-containing protein n=1 Tax=Uliginosibacterium sp. 31-16 TaxID=3068315 RepID=UPI00353220C6
MKRSAELMPLSREHHTALSLARRILVQTDDVEILHAQVMQRTQEILAHFRVEEEGLSPAVMQRSPGLALRLNDEHRALRDYLLRIESGDRQCLKDFAYLLQQHVRFEEREFFPAFEACMREA